MSVRAFLALLLLPAALGAEPFRDAAGLHFHRVPILAAPSEPLAASLREARGVIIDLRGALLSPTVKGSIFAAFPAPNQRQLRLYLINTGTAAGVLRQLPTEATDTLIIGPAHPQLPLEVAVETPRELDAAAVADLAAGGAPATHLPLAPVKQREDEAALAHAREGTTSPAPSVSPAADPERPDPVLTRAVQLFQAWLVTTPPTP